MRRDILLLGFESLDGGIYKTISVEEFFELHNGECTDNPTLGSGKVNPPTIWLESSLCGGEYAKSGTGHPFHIGKTYDNSGGIVFLD